MVGRLRIGVGVLLLAVLVAVFVLRCTADDGDAAADLVRARSLLDQTVTRAGIERGPGGHSDGIGVCMDSFSNGMALMRHPIDLNGRPPADALADVAAFWTESASGVLGASLTVTTETTATGDVTRVTATGDGWWVEAEERLAGEGTYWFSVDGPCTGNTRGSIVPSAP